MNTEKVSIFAIGSGPRGRGRPRKTWKETLRKDLEYLDLTEHLAQNRALWRSRIHTADST
ncbi:hypothetical protein DVH24_013786 [Malus domestica]|uniref:Uncharacterized protein n=1 Tax=Malus domestica TaxID=3750 RepID=A0A498JCI1_MALDO|nr:hypothetical protein DVH24_013786 [Malus domestica]